MMPSTSNGSIGPEFNNFLYAPICEETNGTQLSVLSALARQNVDPWEIARQLTLLPRETAIRFLASMIAVVPAGPSTRPAPEDIAESLVALLPPQRGPMVGARQHAAEVDATRSVAMLGKIQRIVAFTLFVLVGQWLIAGLLAHTNADNPTPAGVTASSTLGKDKGSTQ
jgi:hypothetical protein